MNDGQKPTCRIYGFDRNVFAMIASVRYCLLKDNKQAEAIEFVNRASKARTSTELFSISKDYVELI